MGGFFPHTGLPNSGFTSLPACTYNSVLDDIVTDVGSGVNGWTLFDDQRSNTTEAAWANVYGWNWTANSLRAVSITNGTASLVMPSTSLTGRFQSGEYNVGFTQITLDNGANWYGIASITNQYTMTLDRNYTGTTLSSAQQPIYIKVNGYIVLKCTSSQKTFYVKIFRMMSYWYSLRFQVFETWNAATHTGTVGGPQETIRFSPTAATATATLYLFLLPDVFAAWSNDLFYAGNLIPYRTSDGNALIQACSNQVLSGIGVSSTWQGAASNYYLNGGASCLRNINGTTWANNWGQWGMNLDNKYMIAPRGVDYLWQMDRPQLDDRGSMQFAEWDAYHSYYGGSSMTASHGAWEGKRGELRYLRAPMMSPSVMHQATLGPADDGNTYILLRCLQPEPSQNSNFYAAGDIDSTDSSSATPINYNAFSQAFRALAVSSTLGGTYSDDLIIRSYQQTVFSRRFFLLPINL